VKKKTKSKSKSKEKADIQHVLVLCQRKEGKCGENNGLVQESVVPKINKYVREHLHVENYTIEYLTNLNPYMREGDKVDFNIEIRADSKKFETFIKTHKKKYSVIILNTCPFNHINFQCVNDMLADTGVVVLSQVKCSSIYDTKLFNTSPITLERTSTKKCNILDFFVYDENKGYYTKINWAEFY
jgi:hypothetical protein